MNAFYEQARAAMVALAPRQ